jgi:hypothetical protein
MRNIAHEAKAAALAEKEAGRGNIMVLMPDGWGPVAHNMRPWPEGIHPRFSTVHSGLLSLPIQTLIIVGEHKCTQGIYLAREKLRGHLDPRIIVIRRDDPEPLVLNGEDCWECGFVI